MALPQDQSPGGTPTNYWEKIKKEAEDEASALEAQKKLHDAREALKAAEALPDAATKAMDAKLAEAKAVKVLADAEKASADARKAQADASLAAIKAKIGEVPSAGYTGDVTLKEKAGITEAALLSAKAIKTAGKMIADALPPQEDTRTLLLYAVGEVPNFQALTAFRAQLALVKKAFTEAESTSAGADRKAPEPSGFKMVAVPVAAAGLALEAVNKLLGFFRTDYVIGGLDIKFEDSLLVHALAGAIAVSNKKLKVQLPAVYSPDALSDSGSEILGEIYNMSLSKVKAQDSANRHEKLSARFTEDAGKETAQQKKDVLLDEAKTHKAAADALKAAVVLYDGFFNKLTTAADKGDAPFTDVIRDGIVAEGLMKGNLLLLVKLQQSGGAYYTKKNMLTFFGSMPFYHMGGVVASFVLLDGKNGSVIVSGVIPVHGGFIKANDLPGEMNKNP